MFSPFRQGLSVAPVLGDVSITGKVVQTSGEARFLGHLSLVLVRVARESGS